MWILIALFILLFLVLLLSMPLLVEARLRFGLRGAVLHATVYVLGLIPVPVRLRIRLFSKPAFTVQIGRKRASLFMKKRSGAEGIAEGIDLRRLHIAVTVGVADAPAEATVLAGTLGVLFTMLVPMLAQTGGVRVGTAKTPLLRLTVEGFAIVQPVKAISGYLRRRRIARAKAANNIGKTKEKRTEYASC